MKAKLISLSLFIVFLLVHSSAFSQVPNFKNEEEKNKWVGEQLALGLKQDYKLNDEQFKQAIKIETDYKTQSSVAKKESDPKKKSDAFKKASEKRVKSLEEIMTEEQFCKFSEDRKKRMIYIKKE